MTGILGMVAHTTNATLVSLKDRITSSAETIALPSDIITGDFGVLFDFAYGVSLPPSVIPSGWSSYTTIGSSTHRASVLGKILNISEASTTLTGMVGSTDTRKTLLIFRGNTPITIASNGGFQVQAINGDPSPQTHTIASGNAPLVVLAQKTTAATATLTGSDPLDAATSNNSKQTVGYKIMNVTGSNFTIDSPNDTGLQILESGYIRFTLT